MGNTTWTMNLMPKYFDMIVQGTKKCELRLNDGKRSIFKLGDMIMFYSSPNKSIKVEINGLIRFKSLDDVFNNLPNCWLGTSEIERFLKDESFSWREKWDKDFSSFKYRIGDEVSEDLSKIYDESEVEKYGFLAIIFDKVN